MINTRIIKLVIDGHLHLYPCYNLKHALDSLKANLERIARAEFHTDLLQDIFKIGFLVESRGLNYFEQFRNGTIRAALQGLEIVSGSDGLSITIIQQGKPDLCLIAGKQIVTSENIEILGIGFDESVPDHLPAHEVITQIIDAGGIPVLPWAPGKWLFKRGRIIEKLIENYSPEQLVLQDTSLRPTILPLPGLMRKGMAKGFSLIAGSDPLPIPGEEQWMGTYGFIYEGPFDTDAPVESMRQILFNAPSIILAGRRNKLWNAACRLCRLKAAKRSS